MARIPNINPGGQSIPSGYILGRLSPGTGQQELIPLGDLGRQLVAQAIVPPPGSPTSITLTQPSAGLTITGGPSAFTFALANDLAAVEGLGSTGIAVRTAANTWAQRTITGTADKITVTDGDGVAGNPTLTVSATYAGQASIVTLGTIATGTWQGSVIAGQYGGTGVANTGKTITLGGSLTLTGAFTTEFTVTGNTSVTLPTTGTLATLAGAETLTNKTISGGTLTGNTTLPSSGQLDSSGNLGLGTTPSAKLHVASSNAGAYTAALLGSGPRSYFSNTSTTDNSFYRHVFTTVDSAAAEAAAAGITAIFTNHTAGSITAALTFQQRIAGTIQESARFTTGGLFSLGGGETSSFPALKRSTTVIVNRLADDSGFAESAAGEYQQFGGLNGQHCDIKSKTELTTIAAAATTDTTITIPANVRVIGVSTRVTVAIPTAATFEVGINGAASRFSTGVSTAANTTSPGTLGSMDDDYAAGTAVRITPNAVPAANTGRVRVTIHYIQITPPTS